MAEFHIGGLRYADPTVKAVTPINGKKRSPKKEAGVDAGELLRMDLPETRFVLEPLVAEGLTLFAGKPKIGKTTFVRQILIAANTGGEIFGRRATQVPCLFLCLEEGLALARRKLAKVATPQQASGLKIMFAWTRGDEAVADLRLYLADHPEIRLIVIDSLSKFREPATKSTPQFQQDYAAISGLQEIAKDHPGLAIVVIHHTTKASFDDPLDSISGTYGLTAACDSYGVLMRRGDQYRLHWGGRLWDQEISDFEVVRDDGRWMLLGPWDTEASGLPAVRREILATLTKEGAISTRGVARRFDISDSTASEHLHALKKQGLATKKGNEWRAVARNTPTNTTLNNRNSQGIEISERTERESFGFFGCSFT